MRNTLLAILSLVSALLFAFSVYFFLYYGWLSSGLPGSPTPQLHIEVAKHYLIITLLSSLVLVCLVLEILCRFRESKYRPRGCLVTLVLILLILATSLTIASFFDDSKDLNLPFPTTYRECLDYGGSLSKDRRCSVSSYLAQERVKYFKRCQNSGGEYFEDTDAPVLGGVVPYCFKEFDKPKDKAPVDATDPRVVSESDETPKDIVVE